MYWIVPAWFSLLLSPCQPFSITATTSALSRLELTRLYKRTRDFSNHVIIALNPSSRVSTVAGIPRNFNWVKIKPLVLTVRMLWSWKVNAPYASFTEYIIFCRDAQSIDCPALSSDRYFAQQNMDLLHNPWIVYSACTLRKVGTTDEPALRGMRPYHSDFGHCLFSYLAIVHDESKNLLCGYALSAIAVQ